MIIGLVGLDDPELRSFFRTNFRRFVKKYPLLSIYAEATSTVTTVGDEDMKLSFDMKRCEFTSPDVVSYKVIVSSDHTAYEATVSFIKLINISTLDAAWSYHAPIEFKAIAKLDIV